MWYFDPDFGNFWFEDFYIHSVSKFEPDIKKIKKLEVKNL